MKNYNTQIINYIFVHNELFSIIINKQLLTS